MGHSSFSNHPDRYANAMSTPGDIQEIGFTGPTIYCPSCDYNLTGLEREVCPECGKYFNAAALRLAALREKPLKQRMIRWAIFGLILYAPSACLYLAFYVGKFVMPYAARIWKNDPAGHAYVAWVLLLASVAMYMAQYYGCRIARRQARRAPTDPATPTTLVSMVFYGTLIFISQVMMVIVMRIVCGAFLMMFGFLVYLFF
jgi:hypothetical protein